MTIQQVKELLGTPADRSFRESDEALQYYDVGGFDQCEFLTAWFMDGILNAVTTRRGRGAGGCGPGLPSVRCVEDEAVTLAFEFGLGGLINLQSVQVLQEQQP